MMAEREETKTKVRDRGTVDDGRKRRNRDR